MRILADEGVEKQIVETLRENGYDVKYILEINRGITDDEILTIANRENRVLMTRDKDFGELAYKNRMVHSGIILNRLSKLSTTQKVKLILDVLSRYGDQLLNAFTVIQPSKVRIKRMT